MTDDKNMKEIAETVTYSPRTRHLLDDGKPIYTNRLFNETSPYLQQHAHNPVDWHPWGEEAFKKAKELNRPLFVSIGYSTCHWCHVMEEESFEDEEIAEFLNGHFVPVKVDREELPDVDSVYMSAVQLMNGSGGWPLNVWLTPDFVPFFGGTYFPARDGDRGGAHGFLTMLGQIQNAWTTRPESLLSVGAQLTEFMRQALIPEAGTAIPDASVIDKTAQVFSGIYDPKYGGTRSAPKFPATMNVRFLLRHWKKTGTSASLDMAVNTLDNMAKGGMYDQAGGGFHRYATDEKWLVPHFEKMLYDNALLVPAYLEGWQASGNELFRRVAIEILDYVSKEMTSKEGGFYSATDADTLTPSGEKEEGYFFTWSQEELETILDAEKLALAKRFFSLEGQPHFEGRYIPHIKDDPEEIRKETGLDKEAFEARISEIKQTLYIERQKKEPPFTDTKILTAWNGMMISAFAKAGLVLGEKKYIEAGKTAAEFILASLVKDGILYRSFKDGNVRNNAYLDDYAFLVQGFIDLYEATGETKWLTNAIHYTEMMVELFEDKTTGGFFMTSAAHDKLPAREKPCLDNATPAPNAIAVLNLLRLHSFTDDKKLFEHAEKALTAFSKITVQNPAACSEIAMALDYYYDTPKEIVLITPGPDSHHAEAFLDVFRGIYLPNRVIAVVDEHALTDDVQRMVPLLSGRAIINQATTAYVCESGTCKLPVTEVDAFRKALEE